MELIIFVKLYSINKKNKMFLSDFCNVRLLGEKKQVITVGELSLELLEDKSNLTITDALPMYDEVEMTQEPFTFRVVNNSSIPLNYIVRPIDITTGNISGIFDMSGGANEYVMGYNTAASTVGGARGITTLYSDFFVNSTKWSKYYDLYTNNTNSNQIYNKRILGDATGEMGPFNSNRGSWYSDLAYFVYPSSPWFDRDGHYSGTTGAGVFVFGDYAGAVNNTLSFRVVLTPP